ncbi:MAG: PD-(D/E)XK nuclease family protein [Helicobacter sp.]|uniref:PD-(D/E)XK nuclease family protein n=1 Tax=Helicobacter sp. TaxID=218 RepID=UPI0025C4614E|nr:PD-(D/E)XK nuclease family protein [Helicobacter sp.]MCH5314069.1 PD-(D/E)XK nuclease family protein [Helicobacter sp.]
MKTLKVYSSHRSLMQYLDEGVLLSPHMMMSEFFAQAVIIEGYRALPEAMRLLLSLEILKECAKELQRVNFIFEESFLAFLESSQFLFGFFDELSQAQVDIGEIPLLDTYGDYEDHLYVLEWVQKRYKERLEELLYYDKLILPPKAKMRINEDFIRHFESIHLYIEGIISKAHLALLTHIASLSTLKVHFCFDEYNASLPFLPSYILEQCSPFHRYSFDFKTGEMLSCESISFQAQVRSYSFSLRISQVALVFYMIHQWLQSGVNEEDIAVIVPDEHFVQYLALFDKAHNLNFAMGRDITHSLAYKHLQDMLSDYKEESAILPYERICEGIQTHLASYEDRQSKKVREYVSELLFIWENGGFTERRYAEVLELLLEELKHYSIDDVMGGKIRVMGVLESRGFVCKKVIIVDFNEGVIPSVAQSDLFLNSALRKKLQMPTIKDKEQLQKHYYYAMFSTADEVVVSYVENEDRHRSLLLEEWDKYVKVQEYNGDAHFALLAEGEKLEYCEDSFTGEIPKKLSPSRLKVFLECPRRYFYQHIEYLSDIGQESGAFLGNILHQCLESIYAPYVGKKISLNAREVHHNALKWLESYVQENALSALDRANIKLLSYELEKFLDEYYKTQKGQIEILCLEEQMEAQYGGFVFSVRPDRIQKSDEGIEILDYKYRKNFEPTKDAEKTTDFALLLYKHAFWQNYPQYASLPVKLGYWDIKKAAVVEEESIEEKERILLEKLQSLQGEIVFSKTEKRTTCHYCPFVELCDR